MKWWVLSTYCNTFYEQHQEPRSSISLQNLQHIDNVNNRKSHSMNGAARRPGAHRIRANGRIRKAIWRIIDAASVSTWCYPNVYKLWVNGWKAVPINTFTMKGYHERQTNAELLHVQVLTKVFCSALSTGYKRTPWNPLAVRWALYRLLTRPSRTLCKPRNEPQFFQWKDFTLPDSAQTKMFWWCFLIKSFISIKRKLFLSSSEAPCAQWSTASREREREKQKWANKRAHTDAVECKAPNLVHLSCLHVLPDWKLWLIRFWIP